MTNLNANALEQDADDDDDTFDSWIQYLKAPELTYQHQNILQSLNETSIQDVTYLKPVGHVEGPYTITTKQDGTPKKPRDDGLFKALNSAKNNGEEVVKDWIPKAKPNLLVVADYVLALQITTLNAKSRASLAVWLWEEGVKLHNESFLLGHLHGGENICATLRPASMPFFVNIETPTSYATPFHCGT